MTNLEIILAAVVALMSTYGAVKWAFQKDTEVENRRRVAAQLAGQLSAKGLKRIPAALIDYSVGDYSGMAVRMKECVQLFLDGPGAVEAEFAQVFDSVLAAKLGSESGRAFIAAKLADAKVETDASVVQSAPAPTTK